MATPYSPYEDYEWAWSTVSGGVWLGPVGESIWDRVKVKPEKPKEREARERFCESAFRAMQRAYRRGKR